MKTGLIGWTGFVGGNLARAHQFSDLFNSKNASDMRGSHFDLLVVSGAPAAKWIANQEPEADLANVEQLIDDLRATSADEVVLISTVDVYPNAVGVDEGSPIDREAQQPYGRHRLVLEDAVVEHFDNVLILRLPGLFGPGLKKNVIYDLLNGNCLDQIDPVSVFQFYDVSRLWTDINRCRQKRLGLVNVATEPVSVAAIAELVFGTHIEDRGLSKHAHYDIRTQYDTLLGGESGYLYPGHTVLDDMSLFVGANKGGEQ